MRGNRCRQQNLHNLRDECVSFQARPEIDSFRNEIFRNGSISLPFVNVIPTLCRKVRASPLFTGPHKTAGGLIIQGHARTARPRSYVRVACYRLHTSMAVPGLDLGRVKWKVRRHPPRLRRAVPFVLRLCCTGRMRSRISTTETTAALVPRGLLAERSSDDAAAACPC